METPSNTCMVWSMWIFAKLQEFGSLNTGASAGCNGASSDWFTPLFSIRMCCVASWGISKSQTCYVTFGSSKHGEDIAPGSGATVDFAYLKPSACSFLPKGLLPSLWRWCNLVRFAICRSKAAPLRSASDLSKCVAAGAYQFFCPNISAPSYLWLDAPATGSRSALGCIRHRPGRSNHHFFRCDSVMG